MTKYYHLMDLANYHGKGDQAHYLCGIKAILGLGDYIPIVCTPTGPSFDVYEYYIRSKILCPDCAKREPLARLAEMNIG